MTDHAHFSPRRTRGSGPGLPDVLAVNLHPTFPPQPTTAQSMPITPEPPEEVYALPSELDIKQFERQAESNARAASRALLHNRYLSPPLPSSRDVGYDSFRRQHDSFTSATLHPEHQLEHGVYDNYDKNDTYNDDSHARVTSPKPDPRDYMPRPVTATHSDTINMASPNSQGISDPARQKIHRTNQEIRKNEEEKLIKMEMKKQPGVGSLESLEAWFDGKKRIQILTPIAPVPRKAQVAETILTSAHYPSRPFFRDESEGRTDSSDQSLIVHLSPSTSRTYALPHPTIVSQQEETVKTSKDPTFKPSESHQFTDHVPTHVQDVKSSNNVQPPFNTTPQTFQPDHIHRSVDTLNFRAHPEYVDSSIRPISRPSSVRMNPQERPWEWRRPQFHPSQSIEELEARRRMRPPKLGGRSKREELGSAEESWLESEPITLPTLPSLTSIGENVLNSGRKGMFQIEDDPPSRSTSPFKEYARTDIEVRGREQFESEKSVSERRSYGVSRTDKVSSQRAGFTSQREDSRNEQENGMEVDMDIGDRHNGDDHNHEIESNKWIERQEKREHVQISRSAMTCSRANKISKTTSSRGPKNSGHLSEHSRDVVRALDKGKRQEKRKVEMDMSLEMTLVVPLRSGKSPNSQSDLDSDSDSRSDSHSKLVSGSGMKSWSKDGDESDNNGGYGSPSLFDIRYRRRKIVRTEKRKVRKDKKKEGRGNGKMVSLDQAREEAFKLARKGTVRESWVAGGSSGHRHIV
ncbi:hypothetical protein M231_03550 [Tremella mesenterica]|uniref:Uncharacterized protein n=1 Tax=Tremella mesenterica TaxID=5217 RepID=A0A4Q1BMX0_TREME|nr:hypothetical protein M231_03550 [Tremella mesenterica]